MSWWPDPDGISVRLAVAVAILLGWAAALATRLRHELTDTGRPS